MALKSPDMEDCSPKVNCLGGVNDGLAYDPLETNGQTLKIIAKTPGVGCQMACTTWLPPAMG